MIEEREARMCLAAVVEPGHPAVGEAVAEYGAAQVWASLTRPGSELPLGLRARAVKPGELRDRTSAERLRFVIPGDEEWPAPLSDLAGCETVNQLAGEPLGLWLAGGGNLAELAARSVAVVGSRASWSGTSH